MQKRRLNKRQSLILRWTLPTAAIALLLAGVFVIGSSEEDPAAPDADGGIAGLTSILSRILPSEQVAFSFERRREEAMEEFAHLARPRRSLLPEDMGPGIAWGDYDGDGDADIFLVNYADETTAPGDGLCALLRNDGGTFTDVSGATGLDLRLAGIGAAWGDYDNDGDLDLYVTAFGPNRLLRNDGDTGFTDVTDDAGVGDPSFGAGCAWGDYDNDGLIDLYVCNYVHFNTDESASGRVSEQYGAEIPYTINPSAFDPEPNRLYRNLGNGQFAETASAAGVANPSGRSLGAIWFDFDNDGAIDLYVANDVSSNGVYRNLGDGVFEDIGPTSLAADYRGAMGMAIGDIDRDSDLDLFVTHWVAQENAFFDNMSSEGWLDSDGAPRVFFMDTAEEMGLGQVSLKTVGWSAGFADFNNDGLLDLWVANGHTMQDQADERRLVPQSSHLFQHVAGKGFFDVTADACPDLAPMVGRGGAHADFDGDGDVDICIARHGSSPILLENITTGSANRLRLRLRQRNRNTRALGAVVRVESGGITQTAQVGADGSYLSQHETDLHFGLSGATIVDRVTIRWPDGHTDEFNDLGVNTLQIIEHVWATDDTFIEQVIPLPGRLSVRSN